MLLTPMPMAKGPINYVISSTHFPDWSASCRSASTQRCDIITAALLSSSARPLPINQSAKTSRRDIPTVTNGWPMFQFPSVKISPTKNLSAFENLVGGHGGAEFCTASCNPYAHTIMAGTTLPVDSSRGEFGGGGGQP